MFARKKRDDVKKAKDTLRLWPPCDKFGANSNYFVWYMLLALRMFNRHLGCGGEKITNKLTWLMWGDVAVCEGQKNIVESRIKTMNERPGSQDTNTSRHPPSSRASQTHQTLSTTLKHSPVKAAGFLEDALRDCIRQTC